MIKLADPHKPANILWVGEPEEEVDLEDTLFTAFGSTVVEVDVLMLGNGEFVQLGKGALSREGMISPEAEKDMYVDCLIASRDGKVIAWWGEVDIQKA